MQIMLPLRIITSPLAADLLRLALAHRGIPSDQVIIQYLPSPVQGDQALPAAPRDSDTLEPAAVCLQPGGLRAFREMGLDCNALAVHGTALAALRVLHPHGHRVSRLELSGLSPDPMLVIATPRLRAFLTSAAQACGAPVPREASSALGGERKTWMLSPCPGVLLRVVRGSLRIPQEPVLWDHPRAYVGVGQLPDHRLVMSAIPLFNTPAQRQPDACRAVLDDVVARLGEHVNALDGLVEECWFSLAGVGARPCWDGQRLLWGSAGLQLHPITGMSISYWATQSNRLAEDLARHGAVSARFLRTLDAENRWMVRRNLLSLQFHLCPTWWRDASYAPCLWALQHSDLLRRAVFRRLWLC